MDLFNKSCELKNYDGCSFVADYYDKGKEVDLSSDKALEIYENACDNKSFRACNILINKAPNEEMAFDIRKKACTLGDQKACNQLALAYIEGKGVKPDITKGIDILKKSCGIKNPLSCLNLGKIYEEGRYVKEDLTSSMENYMRGCIYGIKDSCGKAEIVGKKIESLNKK